MRGGTAVSLSILVILGLLPAFLTLGHLPVPISMIGHLVVALLFVGSCGPLAGFALMAGNLHQAPALAAAIPYAIVLAWTLRETTGAPSSRAVYLSIIAVTAGAVRLTAWHAPRPRRLRRFGGGLLAVEVSAALASIVLYRQSSYLRWVLLASATTLGAPLHTLLDGRYAASVSGPDGPAHEDSGADSPAPANLSAEKPNVIVILLDTLRADALAAWGASPRAMPRLDEWASQGYVFRNVLSNASWTRPAVASLFTGLYPEEHGARDRHEALGEHFLTLAEIFRRAGYHTAAVVSNHGAAGRGAGLDQGFETFVEPPQTPYARAQSVRAIAERLVEERDAHRPLFLYLHFLDPPTPYLAGSLPSGTRPMDYLPAYRAELSYLDIHLEVLLRSLASALGSQTWIAITSDHGEEFGEHGRTGHGHSLHRELLQVPFLPLGPDSGSGIVDPPLELRRFHSLLSDLASGSVDPRGWAALARSTIRYSSLEFSSPEAARWRRRYAVARRLDAGKETLIWSAYGNTFELYDSTADPREEFNRASRNPARIAALARTLEGTIPARAPSTPAKPAVEVQLRALGYL